MIYHVPMSPPDALSSASTPALGDPAPDTEAARNHALRMEALEAVIGHGLGLLDEIKRRARAQNAPSPEEQAAKRERDRKLRLVERAVKGAICDFTEDYDEREELEE